MNFSTNLTSYDVPDSTSFLLMPALGKGGSLQRRQYVLDISVSLSGNLQRAKY